MLYDVLVVGAGPSGLHAAAHVHRAGRSVLVLEGRNRVGGRLRTAGAGADLGASWSWPGHDDARVSAEARKLGLSWAPQRLDGAVRLPGGVSVPTGGESMAPCGPGAVRLVGGYAALPVEMARNLPAGAIRLGQRVVAVKCDDDGVTALTSDGSETRARRAVVAAPPAVVAEHIKFDPPLPSDKLAQMQGTATWAGDWAKIIVTFRTPWWRSRGESGCAACSRNDDSAPFSITWEACGGDELGEGEAALAGLSFGEEACRRVNRHGPPGANGESPKALRDEVVASLKALFGPIVEEEVCEVYHTAWAEEELTWVPGVASRAGDPRRLYGHPLLAAPFSFVHFAGTETARHSGHVEGAFAAGARAAAAALAAL